MSNLVIKPFLCCQLSSSSYGQMYWFLSSWLLLSPHGEDLEAWLFDEITPFSAMESVPKWDIQLLATRKTKRCNVWFEKDLFGKTNYTIIFFFIFLFLISKKRIVLLRGAKIATQDMQKRKGHTHPLASQPTLEWISQPTLKWIYLWVFNDNLATHVFFCYYMCILTQ